MAKKSKEDLAKEAAAQKAFADKMKKGGKVAPAKGKDMPPPPPNKKGGKC